MTEQLHFPSLEKEMVTHSSVLAWRLPGPGNLVGCRLWGRTELDTTEATQQQQQHMPSTVHKFKTIETKNILSFLGNFKGAITKRHYKCHRGGMNR